MDREYTSQLIRSNRLRYTPDFYSLLKQVGIEAGFWALDYRPERHVGRILADDGIMSRYKEFEIPKKSGNGTRRIYAPTGELKEILSCVNIILQEKYAPGVCCTGFTRGRSVVSNASVHTGQNYVYNIDLKDFFPSITYGQVYMALKNCPLNFSNDLAAVVSKLCCMKTIDNQNYVHYVLPQGAPTSPVLSNIVCSRLDSYLSGLSSRMNVRYTRYADDMTFSSMYNAFHRHGDLLREVRRIIEGQGFSINEKRRGFRKEGPGRR